RSGGDTILGGAGNDLLYGGAGNDVIRGEEGDDRIDAGAGDDTLDGGTGRDTLIGGAGVDTVVQTVDADQVLTDTALSGQGDDVLSGIERAVLTGGPHDTTFDITGWTGSGAITAGGGHDRLIAGGDEDLTLTDSLLVRSAAGAVSFDSIVAVQLTGGPGAHRLDASPITGRAPPFGGAGVDGLLRGRGGNCPDGGARQHSLE